ncbi:hypothetical protein K435DRAFT_362650 [Dendrothele bispora CBS 962.96]|uniref:Uncharacterized protein n=1 Tax=Dendrothele bispora (strain CBS 962.96) TaxID=1314807 RepID=A0A4S8LD57_DENBC|nr:hypothetical protein K435DRAFT_362650 [Dendrothele bispora CBS 962.96]
MPKSRAPYISDGDRRHVEIFKGAHRLDARGSELNTVGGNQTITINNYYGFAPGQATQADQRLPDNFDPGQITQADQRLLDSFDPRQATQADQRLPDNSICEKPPSSQIPFTGPQALADPAPQNDPVQVSERPGETSKSGVFRFFKMLIAFFSCGLISPSSRHHRLSGEGGASNGPQHDIPLSDMTSPSYGSSAITPTTSDSYHWPQQSGGMRMPEPMRFPSPVHRHNGGPTSNPWAAESYVTARLAPLERAHTLQFPTPTLEQSTVSWGSTAPSQTPVHRNDRSPPSLSTTSPWILESDVG